MALLCASIATTIYPCVRCWSEGKGTGSNAQQGSAVDHRGQPVVSLIAGWEESGIGIKRCLRQQRRRISSDASGLAGLSEIFEHITILQPQGLCHCEESANEKTPMLALSTVAHPTPEDREANKPFHEVVRRFDTFSFFVHEEPHSWLELQEFLTGSRCLGPGRLITLLGSIGSTFFEQGSDLLTDPIAVSTER